MQIVCVSRGSYSRGKELSESLASKLGYQCIGREELIEAAIQRGIAVAKLEAAMLKPHVFTERLVLEKEHYLAFGAVYLLDRLKEGSLVYHGRVGHLLLPGISHIFRIRVVADPEYRINYVMQHLNLDRERAKRYVEDVGGDIKRWVKVFHDVDWDVALQYDVILNLEQMNVGNASAALCTMAQLPEFQPTPASLKIKDDLLLASRARLALAEHEDTCRAPFKVRADNGVVSVTYVPQQMAEPDPILRVLERLEGIEQIVCTKAQSNILWIQERFDPSAETFQDLVSLAQKWDAAVEMLRFRAADEDVSEVENHAILDKIPAHQSKEYNGGIEDDEEEPATAGGDGQPAEDGGMREAMNQLIELGRSAGGSSVRASPRRLIEAIDLAVDHSLVVVGDVFLSKGRAAQIRMARELTGTLHDQLKVPVVLADDLKQQFLFGPRQLVQLVVCFLLAAVIYVVVFTHQEKVLQFLHGETTQAKILAAVCVFSLVPTVAYLYGTAARLFLKLLRIE